ncbi:hypothetical protein [Halobacteriovorax sp. HLS]|uniref:hypothetical protein n=1 Tax=Halobacteriovorax sp. HLS TaxID=2234000 RepID=UPI000FD91214|nr:hypothetical protein [Halobacteriovorax sp. HLS]
MKKIQTQENFSLTRAFIIGDKRSLKKKQKQNFSILQINHLFTPSGIHFSSFFIFFIPLIRLLKRKNKIFLSALLELSLCLMPFGLNQLYSLKRISLLRISNFFLKRTNLEIDFFYIFLVSFFFDFLFGTYRYSPLSFTFSFLFIGVLLSTPKSSFILISFFIANLIITFFFHTQLNILGFILGFLITTVFSLIFPFMFLSYWPSALVGIDLCSPFLWMIKFFVNISSIVSRYSPSVELDFFGFILLLIFSINRKFSILILTILISSSRIYNVPENRIRTKATVDTKDHRRWTFYKDKQIFKDKEQTCYRKIILDGHKITCRQVKK